MTYLVPVRLLAPPRSYPRCCCSSYGFLLRHEVLTIAQRDGSRSAQICGARWAEQDLRADTYFRARPRYRLSPQEHGVKTQAPVQHVDGDPHTVRDEKCCLRGVARIWARRGKTRIGLAKRKEEYKIVDVGRRIRHPLCTCGHIGVYLYGLQHLHTLTLLGRLSCSMTL